MGIIKNDIVRSLLALAIGALIGLAIITSSIYIKQYENLQAFHKFIYSGITASFYEEIFKYLAVLLLIHLVWLEPIFIPFIGLGFGATETIIRVMVKGYSTIQPFCLHIITGFIMALFFYFAFKTQKSLLRGLYYILALILPILLHLSFNLITA